MINEFEIAQQALASLALFQRFYASGDGFQSHKEQVIGMLDVHAEQARQQAGGGRLLAGLSATLRAM